MWSRQRTLAELRLFTCLTEDDDAEVKCVRAHITQALLSDYKYKEYFDLNHYKEEEEESDNTAEVSERSEEEEGEETDEKPSILTSAALETEVKSSPDKLSKRLSTLGLGHFELSSDSADSECEGAIGGGERKKTDCEVDRLTRYLEESAAMKENSKVPEQFMISEDEEEIESEVSSEHSFPEADSEEETEAMKAMGLPVNFGSKQYGKGRKSRLTEKEIRAKFSSVWEEHGELLVYKAFVSIYPDYAPCYDQITGSIPPCNEVVLDTCDQQNSFSAGRECLISDSISKSSTPDHSGSHVNVVNGSGDFKSPIVHGSKDQSSYMSAVSVNSGESSQQRGVSIGGDAISQNGEGRDESSESHNMCVGDHGYAHPVTCNGQSDHGYANEAAQSSEVSEDLSAQTFEEGYDDYSYTHEELIEQLRSFHTDLNNQIYWHVKERISEWYDKHPRHKEFKIKSLDKDLVAITEPYMAQVGTELADQELWQGWEEDDDEESEDEDLPHGLNPSEHIPEALSMMGLTVQPDQSIRENRKRKVVHGTLVYKRKNIKKESKRMLLDFGKSSKAEDPQDQGSREVAQKETSVSEESALHRVKAGVDQEDSDAPEEFSSKLPVEKGCVLPRHIVFDDDDNPLDAATLQPVNTPFYNSSLSPSRTCKDKEEKEAVEENSTLANSIVQLQTESPYGTETEQQSPAPKRRKNKKNKKKKGQNLGSTEGLPKYLQEDASLMKYWYQRYTLFSQFDKGIKMDRESWFSVTPECIAAHIAERCRCDIIIDAFCGAGGNTIQFAMTCNSVIAIDIDPMKLELAKHNAQVYGVSDRIQFVLGDFFHLAPSLKGDVVFLSPPWGGPDYNCREVYDLDDFGGLCSAAQLMETARKISQDVALFIPRNSDTEQLIPLAGVDNSLEIEENFVEKKFKTITAYFGDLAN